MHCHSSHMAMSAISHTCFLKLKRNTLVEMRAVLLEKAKNTLQSALFINGLGSSNLVFQ